MANLLPQKAKKVVRDQVLARNIFALSLLLVVFAIICALSIAPAFITWSTKAEALEYSSDASSRVEGLAVSELRESVSETNKRLTILSGVFGKGATPSAVITAALDARPSGVSIRRIEYKTEQGAEATGKIVLSGVANSVALREEYMSTLQSLSLFSSVTIPISALVRKDGEFTIELVGEF